MAGPSPRSDVRAQQALLNVLPRSILVDASPDDDDRSELVVAGQVLRVHWVGEGNLRDVRQVAAQRKGRPHIVAARRLSPASREVLSKAGIGWVDETGAAEIAAGSLVVSRTGHPQQSGGPARWTPALLAVAEALLCGIRATVATTEEATGLSTGSCTAALRFLTDQGLLTATAQRGRGSGRRVQDPDRLLDAYVRAVQAEPPSLRLEVGLLGRDLVGELVATGRRWARAAVAWAATGSAAAAVLAPYLTATGSVEVYVDADTLPGLETVAASAALRPLEGGRLTLRPFPTTAVRQLEHKVAGLHVAPWPRVYVDLQAEGVRGEEAAEHLRETMHAR